MNDKEIEEIEQNIRDLSLRIEEHEKELRSLFAKRRTAK